MVYKLKLYGLLVVLALLISLGMSWFLSAVAINNDTSIEAWRRATHYQGQLCTAVAQDNHKRWYCTNGASYNRSTLNAYYGYALWVTCKKYPDALVCGLDY